MHKLLIFEYDHNQKIWYQESFFSIIDANFSSCELSRHVCLYYENYYWGEQGWYHTTLMPKIVYITIGCTRPSFTLFYWLYKKTTKYKPIVM